MAIAVALEDAKGVCAEAHHFAQRLSIRPGQTARVEFPVFFPALAATLFMSAWYYTAKASDWKVVMRTEASFAAAQPLKVDVFGERCR